MTSDRGDEAIKHLRVLPVHLTEQSGHLTPTLKLKRSVVMADFAADVEALYARGPTRG